MNSAKNGIVCCYSNASPNKVRTPDLSASAITSVNNRLFPMPGGPSMTSTAPRPCSSAATNAPITFSSPARPRIGGVKSWPPTLITPVEGPTGCPVYRCCTATAVHVIVGSHPSTRNTHRAVYIEQDSTVIDARGPLEAINFRADHQPPLLESPFPSATDPAPRRAMKTEQNPN